MKIGSRLKELNDMITENYDHIWDCCCDHGLLGMMLLKQNKAKKVHFVDTVASIILDLEANLLRYFSDDEYAKRWQTHCSNVAELSLSHISKTNALSAETDTPPVSQERHLIIIAGVGGDRTLELIRSLMSKNSQQATEFLLCPVHHNYKVREALKAMKFGLIQEKLVCENHRFYEILHISLHVKQPISLVGSDMWNFSRFQDREYLNKTIKHYQNKSKDSSNDLEEVISAYRNLKLIYQQQRGS